MQADALPHANSESKYVPTSMLCQPTRSGQETHCSPISLRNCEEEKALDKKSPDVRKIAHSSELAGKVCALVEVLKVHLEISGLLARKRHIVRANCEYEIFCSQYTSEHVTNERSYLSARATSGRVSRPIHRSTVDGIGAIRLPCKEMDRQRGW